MAYNLKGFPELWRSFTSASNGREISSYLDLNGFGDAWNRALHANENNGQKSRKHSVGLDKLDGFAPAWETALRAGIQKVSEQTRTARKKQQGKQNTNKVQPQAQQTLDKKTNKNNLQNQGQNKSTQTAFPDWLLNIDESEFRRENRREQGANLDNFQALWEQATNESKISNQNSQKSKRVANVENQSRIVKKISNKAGIVEKSSSSGPTGSKEQSTTQIQLVQHSSSKIGQLSQWLRDRAGQNSGRVAQPAQNDLRIKLAGRITENDRAGFNTQNDQRDASEHAQVTAFDENNNFGTSRRPQISKDRITAALFYLANAGLGQWASPLLREASKKGSNAFGLTAVFLSEVARRAKLAQAIGKFDKRSHAKVAELNQFRKDTRSKQNSLSLRVQSRSEQSGRVQENAVQKSGQSVTSNSPPQGLYADLQATILQHLRVESSRGLHSASGRKIAYSQSEARKFVREALRLSAIAGSQNVSRSFGKNVSSDGLCSQGTTSRIAKGSSPLNRTGFNSHKLSIITEQSLKQLSRSFNIEEHQLASIVSKNVKISSCGMSERCGYMKQSGSWFINVKVRKYSIFHKP
jgi:hypothetical protein